MDIPYKCQDTSYLRQYFFLRALARGGKVVRYIIMDEKGSLACCVKFTSMNVDEFPGITIKTTGGYASWINGKSERANETLKKSTQAVILDAAKDVIYWCYTYTNVVKKYNCTIQSATNDCPENTWFGICPSIHHFISYGYVIYPHIHHPKAPENRHVEGYYMGTTNSNSLIEWLDPSTSKVKQ
eukprot:12218974-Ditylum_brightwellii.AAC.1